LKQINADGAIIGSAIIKLIEEHHNDYLDTVLQQYLQTITAAR
jgi:tryptophan synthase alpha subunit